jgi:hypothetical protein
MRIPVFFLSLSIFVVAILVLGATQASLNPYSQSENKALYDIRFPSAEITRLKLDQAAEASRYDVGLFGNSRSEMVGRAELGLRDCKFFNYSASGESIRNSLGLLEHMVAQGKAPRIALISFDHMELAMVNNPGSLPYGEQIYFASRDLAFAVASPDMSLRDTARLAARYARGVWTSITSMFSSEWLLEVTARSFRGDLAPRQVPFNSTLGHRSDGSHVNRTERNVSVRPFKPATGDEIIDALLKNDLMRFKALERGGENSVEKIIIYESPLSPPFDKQYAERPRPRTASHRRAYLETCRSLSLTCFAAPLQGTIEPDRNAWRDASHAPPVGLSRYLRRLIKNIAGCNSAATSSFAGYGFRRL